MASVVETILDDPAVSGGLVVGGVVAVMVWPTVVRRTNWSRFSTLLMLLGVAWYVAVSLTPAQGAFGATGSISSCLTTLADVTGGLDGLSSGGAWSHVLFTLPAAFFAALAVRRTWPVMAVGVLVPALVEILQSGLLGRACSGGEWLSSAGGALIGAALGAAVLGVPDLWQGKGPKSKSGSGGSGGSGGSRK